MKKLVVGILAHVDSGKTTLSEAMLYTAGKIRKLGRVDHKDAYLDTDAQERERGITIFSKQAVFTYDGMEIMLISRRKWNEPYRCLTMRFLSLMAWTGYRVIPIRYGSC